MCHKVYNPSLHSKTVKFYHGIAAIVLAGTLSCNAPQRTQPSSNCVPTQEDLQSRIISAAMMQKSRLLRISREARDKGMERGGFGVWENGRLIIYEVTNDVSLDKDRYLRHRERHENNLNHFANRAQLAASSHSRNTPSLSGMFSHQASMAISNLQNASASTGPLREEALDRAWANYSILVLQNLYIPNFAELERLKERGQIIFGFHTHTGSPPSRIDLDNSHSEPEIVVSVNDQNQHTIYFARGGNYFSISTTEPYNLALGR